MNDRFDEWNEVKKDTQQKTRAPFRIKSKEIYWVNIGYNIGDEQYGKGKTFSRPVLVVRQLTSDLFVGVPLTSNIRDDDYFYSFTFQTKKGIVKNSAMILQIRTFSKKRMTSKLGKMSATDFENIKNKISKAIIPT